MKAENDAVQIFGRGRTVAPMSALEISMGAGDDWLELNQVYGTTANLYGQGGGDSIMVYDSWIDSLFADFGNGYSGAGFQVGYFYGNFRILNAVSSGSSRELITLSATRVDDVLIDVGDGNDIVNTRGIVGGYSKAAVSNLSVRMGPGNDELHWSAIPNIHNVFFRGGSGTNDRLLWYGGNGNIGSEDIIRFEIFR